MLVLLRLAQVYHFTLTAVSNTAIIADAAGPAGEDNLLVAGTSIPSWTATYTSPGDYVTAYATDIAAGTTTTTFEAVTAVTLNYWLVINYY